MTNGSNQNDVLIVLANIAAFIPLISSHKKFFFRNVIVKQPEIWWDVRKCCPPPSLSSFFLSVRKNSRDGHMPPATLGTWERNGARGAFPWNRRITKEVAQPSLCPSPDRFSPGSDFSSSQTETLPKPLVPSISCFLYEFLISSAKNFKD